MVDVFKALGDKFRLQIVEMLLDGEMCVCDIIEALPLSQPAVSHHLKILKQAEVVNAKKHGKWVCYSLNSETVEIVYNLLENMKRTTDRFKQEQSTCCNDKCFE